MYKLVPFELNNDNAFKKKYIKEIYYLAKNGSLNKSGMMKNIGPLVNDYYFQGRNIFDIFISESYDLIKSLKLNPNPDALDIDELECLMSFVL